jgi:hypothetical protein
MDGYTCWIDHDEGGNKDASICFFLSSSYILGFLGPLASSALSFLGLVGVC